MSETSALMHKRYLTNYPLVALRATSVRMLRSSTSLIDIMVLSTSAVKAAVLALRKGLPTETLEKLIQVVDSNEPYFCEKDDDQLILANNSHWTQVTLTAGVMPNVPEFLHSELVHHVGASYAGLILFIHDYKDELTPKAIEEMFLAKHLWNYYYTGSDTNKQEACDKIASILTNKEES